MLATLIIPLGVGLFLMILAYGLCFTEHARKLWAAVLFLFGMLISCAGVIAIGTALQ